MTPTFEQLVAALKSGYQLGLPGFNAALWESTHPMVQLAVRSGAEQRLKHDREGTTPLWRVLNRE